MRKEWNLAWTLFATPLWFSEVSAPTAAQMVPATNQLALYAKDNGSGTSALFYKDDAGVEHDLSGGSAAPADADYLVKTANGSLSAERVVTDTASIVWDWSTGGQAKATRAALTGDVTASSNSNSTTIANNAVSDAKLRDSGALSVIGRSANSSGDPADISTTAATDAVLRESGSALGFGTIATGGIANDAVTNAKLANMAAWSVKLRNNSASGDASDAIYTDLTTATPASGDWLIGFLSTGEIRKYDADGFLSSGGSGGEPVTNGDAANPELVFDTHGDLVMTP